MLGKWEIHLRFYFEIIVFCLLIFRHWVHCIKKHRTTFQNWRPNWSYFCPCLRGYAKSFPSTNSIGKIWHDIFGNSRQKSTILFRWPRVWTFQTIFTFLQKKHKSWFLWKGQCTFFWLKNLLVLKNEQLKWFFLIEYNQK